MRQDDKIAGSVWLDGDEKKRTWLLSVWCPESGRMRSNVGHLSHFFNVPGVPEMIAKVLSAGAFRALVGVKQAMGESVSGSESGSRIDAAATVLWELLDEISTLGDSIKPSTPESFQLYYQRVNAIADKRFGVMKPGPLEQMERAARVVEQLPAPIPIRLHCPECGALHVDSGMWSDVPHHTHACQECGHVWRPAKVFTVGVQFLPGYKNDV